MKRRVIPSVIAFALATVCQAAPAEEKPRSLSYSEAVELGLEKNLDLLALKLAIPLSEAEEMLAGALANPTLQLDTQLMPFGSNWNQTTSGGPSQQDLYANIPIDLTQKRSKARKAVHHATLATEAQFQNQILQKKGEIQLSYLSLAQLQSLVDLYLDRQEIFDHLEKLIYRRTGSTQILPQLLERSRVASAQVRFELESKKAELSQEVIRLNTLLGNSDVSEPLRATTSLQVFPKYLKSFDTSKFIEMAYESRSDLKALKFQKAQAELELDTAHAKIFDDLILIAGASYQNRLNPSPNLIGINANSPEIPGSWSWITGLIIPLPLFSQNSGGIRRSHVLQDQTETQIRALELQIRSDIQIAMKELEVTSKQLRELEGSTLSSARAVRDGVQRLFGTGKATLLEYLDAMNAYFELVTSYFQSLSNHRKAIIHLNESIGKEVLQ